MPNTPYVMPRPRPIRRGATPFGYLPASQVRSSLSETEFRQNMAEMRSRGNAGKADGSPFVVAHVSSFFPMRRLANSRLEDQRHVHLPYKLYFFSQ